MGKRRGCPRGFPFKRQAQASATRHGPARAHGRPTGATTQGAGLLYPFLHFA